MWDANTALPLRQFRLGGQPSTVVDGAALPHCRALQRGCSAGSRRGIAAGRRRAYTRAVCTLALYFQASEDFPIVVAANRDEFYERPSAPPVRLADDPWVVAGQDLVAGGTWLGVNAHNIVGGIVNRRSSLPPDPTRCSRGQLCIDTLRHSSVTAAHRRLMQDPGALYNPFNLLIASPEAACVVGNVSGAMASIALTPGLHLLTNLELNDFECPRIAKSYGLFDATRRYLRRDAVACLLPALRRILSDHSTPLDPRSDGPPNNLCVHTGRFGTRSSSILLYVRAERRFRLWHANGAPCEVDYSEVALPPAPALAPALPALDPIGQL
jgi:uncharacterized protein with NRDE domain